MANLPETPDYPAGVYQLETSDPVLGGPGGISNRQAEQLGNRTAWLKAKIDGFIAGTLSVAQAFKLAAARTISITGAASGSASFDGSADVGIAITLADSGALAGTYSKVTINAKGLVTGGQALGAVDIPNLDWSKITSGKPTTLGGYGITDAAPANSPALTGTPTAPTPPQFDNDTSLATTEFVQRALGNKRLSTSIQASRAITLADFGGEFLISAPANTTVTLPSISTVPEGASIRFINMGLGPCIFNRSGTAAFIGAFNPGGMATSFTLHVTDEVSVTRYGDLWLVIGSGSIQASATETGWRYIGGGLIEQWGSVTGPASPANNRWDLDVTFPFAFPNTCFSVMGNAGIAVVDLDLPGSVGPYRASESTWQVGVPTTAGYEAAIFYKTGTTDSRKFHWRAIGR